MFIIYNSTKASEYQDLSTLTGPLHQEILTALDEYSPNKAYTLINEYIWNDRNALMETLNKAIKKYTEARNAKYFNQSHFTKEIQDRLSNDIQEYLKVIKLLHEKLNIPLNIEEFYKEPYCCTIL